MADPLPFVVEPMRLTDLDQVMAIERDAFSAPWSVHAYRYEILKNKYSTMLVAREAVTASKRPDWLPLLSSARKSPVLSYGGFWLLVDEVHISTIAVSIEWRGRGLGELLLISLLDRGVRLGAHRATLEVRISNLAAQGLYRKYGFETTARQKQYYADNNEDAFIMATPLFASPRFQNRMHQCRVQLHKRLSTEDYHLSSYTNTQEILG
jgi:ribosomal-protein-alanine N-acetyltransferase